MKRQKQDGHKTLNEFTRAETCDEIEHICGLRPPSGDEPNLRELFAEFDLASNILVAAQDAADPDEAKIAGIEQTLKGPAMPIEELIVPIERVLGRPLLAGEIEAGTLFS